MAAESTHNLRTVQLKTRRRAHRDSGHTPARRFEAVPLRAPDVFSVVDNPDEVLEFLTLVCEVLKRQNVLVDLRHVRAVTPDALLALVTCADEVENAAGGLYGNVPDDPEVRAVLDTCSFDKLVKGLQSNNRGGFVETKFTSTRVGYRVDEEATENLVRKACEQSGLPYHPISYSNLVECMTNTNNHAGQKPGAIAWRLMIACDRENHRVRFIFVDPGFGICRTVKFTMARFALKFLELTHLTNGMELLKVLMNPDVGFFAQALAGLPQKTRTGLPGRGRGLRKIAQSLARGKLARLVVIANDGYVDVSRATTRVLPGEGFAGTLVYWEIGPGTEAEPHAQ